jgi:hypothetical protein
MRVFIAGVMQGSRLDRAIDSQSYRVQLANALQRQYEAVEIIDPWRIHPNSVDYEDRRVVDTFLSMTSLAGEADVLLAYLPTASMGTAIELWTAYHAGVPTVVVTPMAHNWAVKVTAAEVLPDLDSLLDYISTGKLRLLVDSHNGTDYNRSDLPQ